VFIIKPGVYDTSNHSGQNVEAFLTIYFVPQHLRELRKLERELKKVLRDTLTRAAWYGLLSTTSNLANQIARLAAIVVKTVIIFPI